MADSGSVLRVVLAFWAFSLFVAGVVSGAGWIWEGWGLDWAAGLKRLVLCGLATWLVAPPLLRFLKGTEFKRGCATIAAIHFIVVAIGFLAATAVGQIVLGGLAILLVAAIVHSSFRRR